MADTLLPQALAEEQARPTEGVLVPAEWSLGR